MPPGSLSTIKGTGYPDYRRRIYGTVAVRMLGGSVDISGTIEHILVMGTLHYTGTLRKVGIVGTVRHVGTIAKVDRVGTVAARLTDGKVLIGTSKVHSAVGSRYTGSWEDISRFHVKSYQVLSTLAGSLYIMGGARGTSPGGLVGTMYQMKLRTDQFETFSFREDFQYSRAIVRTGSVAPGKGTLRLARNFQS